MTEGVRYVIGLDVGGTKIAGGVVAFPSGKVVRREVVQTLPERGGMAVLADTVKLAKRLAAGHRISAIGVGVAELVDGEGNITSAHTIAWRGIHIKEEFTRLAPTVIESDVRAAALAEAWF